MAFFNDWFDAELKVFKKQAKKGSILKKENVFSVCP